MDNMASSTLKYSYNTLSCSGSSQVALHMLPLPPDSFPQCPSLHGLTETEPLPIIPMDTVIDMGAGGRPEGSRT